MSGTIDGLYRYPVKGLSAQKMTDAKITKGRGFAYDRYWAIENGTTHFNSNDLRHLPKSIFTQLARLPKLALVETVFEEEGETLALSQGGKELLRAELGNANGRRQVEQFIEKFLGDEMSGPARMVSAPGHHFSDIVDSAVSVINLASVRDFADKIGRDVDPGRFRGNVYLEGLEPWVEMDWLDKEVWINGVQLFTIIEITGRCPATHVNLETGERDIDLKPLLLETYGHSKCGFYMMADDKGALTINDIFKVD